MCTVTLIPLPGEGVRLVTNRDENRNRGPAIPPAMWPVGAALRAAYPLDGSVGGTWVAVTERGLLFALLNLNLTPSPPTPARHRSRGTVIPQLAGAADVDGAARRLESVELERLAPFRLLIADTEAVRVASWSGEKLGWAGYSLAPMCLASSGLGDERVLARLTLFEEWMNQHGPTPAAQDAFHRHTWPDRPEISVMMSRSDARTVSVTAIELRSSASQCEAMMLYRDDTGEQRVEFSIARLAAAGSA